MSDHISLVDPTAISANPSAWEAAEMRARSDWTVDLTEAP